MYNVRRIIKLIPIIWGFFIFNSYGQRMGIPIIRVSNDIEIEITNLRMSGIFQKIEIIDLNNKNYIHIVRYDSYDDYYVISENNIGFKTKILKLNILKKKGGKLNFIVKVYTNKKVYEKAFNPSIQRLNKIIKIKWRP
jgi:hypothetical protein